MLVEQPPLNGSVKISRAGGYSGDHFNSWCIVFCFFYYHANTIDVAEQQAYVMVNFLALSIIF